VPFRRSTSGRNKLYDVQALFNFQILCVSDLNMSSLHSFSGWESYPVSTDIRILIDQDTDSYRRRLVEDSPRLFAPDRNIIRSLRVSAKRGARGARLVRYFYLHSNLLSLSRNTVVIYQRCGVTL
jgi:hypothetical protein